MKKISAKLKFFLINLAAAIVLICGISIYTLYWLDDYTQHDHFIRVPSLHDMTPEEAEAVAKHAKLRILVIDSIYNKNAKPGTVVEQYPASESKVKENRLIHLTINANSPEKIIFPDLQNAAYRQTLQTLQTRGFKIGRIKYVPSEFKNLVIQLKHNNTEIHPGTLLSKGATIDIVLGKGDEDNTVLPPQLTGKKLDEAIDLIRKSYLNVGQIIPDGSISNPKNKMSAFVYQQIPSPNHPIQAGSSVNVYITLKQEKIAALDLSLIQI
ncbi:MAG: PASTA domain-containing protein [Odoribacter sp.]|nr:PASTA domain-containing protein [Odoribacter sp.]